MNKFFYDTFKLLETEIRTKMIVFFCLFIKEHSDVKNILRILFNGFKQTFVRRHIFMIENILWSEPTSEISRHQKKQTKFKKKLSKKYFL